MSILNTLVLYFVMNKNKILCDITLKELKANCKIVESKIEEIHTCVNTTTRLQLFILYTKFLRFLV